MGIDKLISKFDKVKKAINSIKGIQSKIQAINYTTALDALDEAKDKADVLIKARKQSLNAEIGAGAIGKAYSKKMPAQEGYHIVYPQFDNMKNYIVFHSRPRLKQGSEDFHPVYMERSVSLFVPDALISQAAVTYNADGVGSLGKAIASTIDNFTSGEDDAYKKTGEEITKIGIAALSKMANAATGGLTNLKFGVAKNPMQEQLLNGVPFRSWDFTFDFWPKTRDESQTVQEIIYFFRSSMLPDAFSITKGEGLSVERQGKDSNNLKFFNYPNVFDIKFAGQMADKIDGFLPAVCASAQVDYTGGQKFTTFDDGMPVHIQLTLNFLEIKTMSLGNYDNYVSRYRGKGSSFEEQQSVRDGDNPDFEQIGNLLGSGGSTEGDGD